MAAYVISQARILDARQFRTYQRLALPSVRRHGGRFLIFGGEKQDVEGHWDTATVVMAEFESMEAARRWYESDEYRAARKAREGIAEFTMSFVQGR